MNFRHNFYIFFQRFLMICTFAKILFLVYNMLENKGREVPIMFFKKSKKNKETEQPRENRYVMKLDSYHLRTLIGILNDQRLYLQEQGCNRSNSPEYDLICNLIIRGLDTLEGKVPTA